MLGPLQGEEEEEQEQWSSLFSFSPLTESDNDDPDYDLKSIDQMEYSSSEVHLSSVVFVVDEIGLLSMLGHIKYLWYFYVRCGTGFVF